MQVSEQHRDKIAKTAMVPTGVNLETIRTREGFDFPFIVKPDIGYCGFGVQRINSRAEMLAYQAQFPKRAALLIQRLVEGPGEAGLLYVRSPGEARGTISALTLRHRPSVMGDGRSSVLQLIAAQPHRRRVLELYRRIIDETSLSHIPSSGERVVLTTVASSRVGGLYESAPHLITPRLTAMLDDVAQSMGKFHFGRFDVKFTTEAKLSDGEFVIIEINGAGSEAIQFWDPRYSRLEAFRGVFDKQRRLFSIAREMQRRGHKPLTVHALAALWFKQGRLIRDYPTSN